MNRRGPSNRPRATASLQAEVGAGGVAHGGEAAAQHGRHQLAASAVTSEAGASARPGQVVRGRHHVHMGVDQPRQHHAAGGVDLVGDIVDGDRLLRRRRSDAFAFDDEGAAVAQDSRFAVEQPSVADDLAGHGADLAQPAQSRALASRYSRQRSPELARRHHGLHRADALAAAPDVLPGLLGAVAAEVHLARVALGQVVRVQAGVADRLGLR
jgi:hypothetical protein